MLLSRWRVGYDRAAASERRRLHPVRVEVEWSMMKWVKKAPRFRRARIRAKAAPGAPPGTLVGLPDATKPKIEVISYGPDDLLETAAEDLEAVREVVGVRPVTWLNVDGVGHAETIEALGELFDLHPLALEDVINVHQRPKLEEYESSAFIVARMLPSDGEFETEQVSIFVGRDFVLTLQEREGDCFEPVRSRIRSGRPRIRGSKADYLAYALLDAIVDSYFPTLERISEQLYALEDEIVKRPSSELLTRLYGVKRELLSLRRAIWPLRDVLSSAVRDPTPFFDEDTRIFLRDCYDHAVRIIDLVETYRELCSSLTDFYMSVVGHKMNEIMKVLTIIATIFIPLTFIAGIYGMNFDREASPWSMPELGWYWGYPFALALMVAITVGMVLYFRRRGWF